MLAPALPPGGSRAAGQPAARVARGTQGPERIDPTPTGRVKVVQLAQGSSPHSRGRIGDVTQTDVTAVSRAQASMHEPDVTRVRLSTDAATIEDAVLPDLFAQEPGARDATLPDAPAAEPDDEIIDEFTSVNGPSSLITFVARTPAAADGDAGITRVTAPAGSDSAPLPRLTARLRKKSGVLN